MMKAKLQASKQALYNKELLYIIIELQVDDKKIADARARQINAKNFINSYA